MKATVRSILRFLMSSDLLWQASRRLPVRGIVAARKQIVANRLAESCGARPIVRSGPFRGMVYPEMRSAGSALVPKLLGTYESELHPFIESLADIQLQTIVDVGCAEGYYAVGLARRFPNAPVLAYDIADEARRLCAEMAGANGASRVKVRGLCDRQQLLALDPLATHLIIADCEGFEKQLFDREVARHLSRSYLLVELHDFKDRSISQVVPGYFSGTHEVTLIPSIDDREKAVRYSAEELDLSDPFEREVAFAENRPEGMAWMIARPHPIARGKTTAAQRRAVRFSALCAVERPLVRTRRVSAVVAPS